MCAFVVEPILYEGVVVPDTSYMKKLRDLCTDYNVLFVANEIHCGLGRAGSLICSDLFEVKPDILVVGEMLTGGIVPVGRDIYFPSSNFATYFYFSGIGVACR